MSYFNTTQETSTNLKQFEAKAESQEQQVLTILRRSSRGMTASEIFRAYPDKRTPLTSVRRALTNLCNDKRVVKTAFKREGLYGRNEFVFTVCNGQLNLFN